MSNNEAKFVLNAYRPDGRDANDPAFSAALAQAKADPVLGAWFAREQAHGAAVATKLRQIGPPSGLRDAILAGGRATGRVTPQRVRWPLSAWMALAACVALLAAVSVTFWPKHDASFDALTAFAIDDVAHGRHGGHGAPEEALQARLSNTDTHVAAGMPVDFSALKQSGCRTLHVAGHDILEVCFVRSGAEFHCYICRAGDFTSSSERASGLEFVQRAGLAAAAWSRDGLRYVLVGDAGLDAVKRLL